MGALYATKIPCCLVLQRNVAPCAVPGAGFTLQIAAEDGGFELGVAL
jgi:hypothetical protein